MDRRVHYGGLVIAGIGFFLTRFTVTLAIYEDPVRFYLAGIVPLVLGLGLAAFGVALAVADVEPALVGTTARWCVVGVATMLVLVLLTLVGSTSGMPDVATVRSRVYLSNFLIGGSVGGTLTGIYAARNRQQRRTLRQQANRIEVLNRLLRHEVLNGLTVVRGYATGGGGTSGSESVVEERLDAIERVIDEVKFLTRSAGAGGAAAEGIDLGAVLAESVETVRGRYPDADVSVAAGPEGAADGSVAAGPEGAADPGVAAIPEDLTVSANERLWQVFTHLLENAVVHATAEQPAVEVSVTPGPDDVAVSVRDEGPGLPESQRALLETGEIEEFDDPGSGFGLNVVRLLVESYGGTIDTDVDPDGTTITVALRRRESAGPGFHPTPADLTGVRPAAPHLVVTLGAALVAGVAYGLVAEHLGGSVAGIGVFYGTASPVVGWVTHEFHSVVFGFVLAGLVSLAPSRYRNHVPAYVAIGTAWALVLWLVAAGIVAPIWLRLLARPAAIPNLSPVLFWAHLAWGVSLGLLTALGYEYAAPWLSRRVG